MAVTNNSPARAAAIDTSVAIAAAIDVDDDIDFYAITSNEGIHAYSSCCLPLVSTF